jgi:phospholipase/carboxylesterase
MVKWTGLLAALAILGAVAPSAGQSATTEVQVQGHRCLVASPADLPEDAPVVFILHGLRANCEDLFSLIEMMNLPPCRYVLPDAPITLGEHAFGWYDFPTQSWEDTVKSRDYLFTLMDRFSTEGLQPGHVRPIILMGFSQGGVMSMEAGLNYKGKVLAIVSMSGYIWDPAKTLARPLAPHRLPILLVHGTNDTLVPEDWTLKTVKALRKAGYKPVFKEFPMAHQITPDSLAVVSQFLKKVVSPK